MKKQVKALSPVRVDGVRFGMDETFEMPSNEAERLEALGVLEILGGEYLTVPMLKEKLGALKIDYDPKSKRDDLLVLLEGAENAE